MVKISLIPKSDRPSKCDCKPIKLRSRQVIWTKGSMSYCCLMILAAATLLILTVANELSAKVTASILASSSFLIFLKNKSVSRCFGVSSSTIIVGLCLTFDVRFCFCVGFSE